MEDEAGGAGQFKWAILNDARSIQDIGVAYGLGQILFPEKAAAEIDELVRSAMLELLDEGLIFLFRSSWDDVFRVDLDHVDPLERAEVASELAAGGAVVDRPDRVLFFRETSKGADVYRALPPGSVPRRPDAWRR